MREIKFRAWDEMEKLMFREQEYNTYEEINIDEGELIAGSNDENGDWYELKLMQFTGLKDKNGKEIYEGDIVLIDWKDNRYGKHKGIVEWNIEQACWEFGAGATSELDWSHEVIGNIYENPELLEEKE